MNDFEKAKKWIKGKEKNLAKSVLKFKLSKEGKDNIDEQLLNEGAERAVLEANKIVKAKGRDIVSGIGAFIKNKKNNI